jgi:hypothetical protein
MAAGSGAMAPPSSLAFFAQLAVDLLDVHIISHDADNFHDHSLAALDQMIQYFRFGIHNGKMFRGLFLSDNIGSPANHNSLYNHVYPPFGSGGGTLLHSVQFFSLTSFRGVPISTL